MHWYGAFGGRDDWTGTGRSGSQGAQRAGGQDNSENLPVTLWDLPGVKRFVESECETPLRDGASVIARFPGAIPLGFEDAATAPLENYLSIGKVRATAAPLEDLCAQFAAGGPAHVRTIQELCKDRSFGGRLVWVDGLSVSNWTAWRAFLVHYAQVSRSMPLAGRTLFFAPLTGVSSNDLPASDVALATCEWDGVPDELDLMLFANERLRERVGSAVLRTLLTTIVARVASWDFDSAARMLMGDRQNILDPVKSLREIAHAKDWTHETPVSWELGTASKTGVAHPARAALDDPPPPPPPPARNREADMERTGFGAAAVDRDATPSDH